MNEARMLKYHGIWRIHLEDSGDLRGHITGNVLEIEGSKEVLIDLNAFNLRYVRKCGFPLSKNLRIIYRRLFRDMREPPAIRFPALALRPYQIEGVEFLLKRRGNVLLADEMGLGKTPQVLTYLETTFPELTIIVCPAHLKYMWQDEYKKFYPKGELKFVILAGRKNYTVEDRPGTVIVVNFEILQHWVEYLVALGPDTMVVDEGHNAKTVKSRRGKAVDILSVASNHRIIVTGTPVLNTLADLWTLVRFVNPLCLGGWTTFCNRYIDRKERKIWKRVFKYGKTRKMLIRTFDDSQTKNLKELHSLLHRTVMLRRLKSDVLPQLPAKQRQYIWIDVPNKALEEARRNWIRACKKEGATAQESVKTFAVMRRLLAESKVNTAIDWIHEAQAKTSKPLIVIGWHRSPLQRLHEVFPKSRLLIGDCTPTEKHQIAKDFQLGKIPLLLANIQSGGTGLTLTRADTTLFLELPLTDGMLSQAEDRTHRISQESLKVNYVYLLIKKTIEERIMEIIIQKRTLGKDVLDAGIDTRKIMDYLLDGAVDMNDTPQTDDEWFKRKDKKSEKPNRGKA